MPPLEVNQQESHFRFAHQEKRKRKGEELDTQIYLRLGHPFSRDDECNFRLQRPMTSESISHRRGDPTVGNFLFCAFCIPLGEMGYFLKP